MTAVAVGYKLPTIKPDDLVRTPSGRTARCLELRPRGFRLLEDIVTKARTILHVQDLFLVSSAPIKRWPSHTP